MIVKNFATGFIDAYNAAVGAGVTVLLALFGEYWYLLAAFMLFNLLDWLTGWYKAHKTKTESSATGLAGIIKKLLYWVIVLVAFVVAEVMGRVGGALLGTPLPWIYLLGWFTLACLFVNEARSILENVVAAGVQGVPAFLTQGLAIAQKLLADTAVPPLPKGTEGGAPAAQSPAAHGEDGHIATGTAPAQAGQSAPPPQKPPR